MSQEKERKVGVFGGGVCLGTDTPTTAVVDQFHRLRNFKLTSLLTLSLVHLAHLDKRVKPVFSGNRFGIKWAVL